MARGVKLLNPAEPRVYAVVFGKGDEVVAGLEAFAVSERLRAAQITAIGGLRAVTLGYFDPERKEYRRNELGDQLELLSLVGDFSLLDDRPKLHAHVSVAGPDAAVRGGHLLSGTVWPTLEAVVTALPSYLVRRLDPETGLPLLAP